MTVNKNQGQTFDKIDVFLPNPVPVFTHGQLYVAFSRDRRFDEVKFQLISTTEQRLKVFRWCVSEYIPEELPHKDQLEVYKSEVFVNLTGYICKDATIKLRHAERIQETYKHSISYELGTISAGIQDSFRHMLQVYQKYSNMTHFRLNMHSMEEILEAYHIIKGDFNALRMEKNLYYEILARHTKRTKAKSKPASILDKLKKGSKVLRRRNPKEELYKKNLRYKAWNERWENFRPEIEGIDIDLDVDV